MNLRVASAAVRSVVARSRTRRVLGSTLLAVFLTSPLQGQATSDSFSGGVAGFGLGVAGGLVMGAGLLTTRAIVFNEPFYGGDEVESWGYAITALSAAGGSMYGATHPDDLGEVAVLSGAGMVVGGLTGLLLGSRVDHDRRFGWAAIGAAAGLLGGAILSLATDDPAEPGGSALRAPVTLLRLRLP